MGPPGADRKNQQDRIAPEHGRGAIGDRHKVEIDRLHQMRHAVSKLQRGNPERPKSIRSHRDRYKGDEHDQVDGQKTEFDVVIVNSGDKKINVIKEIRALTNLGLGEAKALSETANAKVLENVSKDKAQDAKKKLEAAGATVELK